MALTDQQLQAIDLIMAGELSFAQIAEAVGCHTRTLFNWRKDNQDFIAAINMRSQSAVDNALYERAVINKDPNAMKLWYARYGNTPVKEDPLVDMFNLTDSDIEEIAHDAYDYVRAKKGNNAHT